MPKAGGPISQPTNVFSIVKTRLFVSALKYSGGALRLTKCNIGAICEDQGYADFECVCDVDPLCAPWEKDKVAQSFPPEDPDCQLCGNGVLEGDEECDGAGNPCGACVNCTCVE